MIQNYENHKGLTTSQVSGMVQGHEANLERVPVAGETLLSQYKQCNAVNDQQLRDAKNIKDLVQINVKTLDKKLFVQSRGGNRRGGTAADSNNNETSYNLSFDPINFLQKVPCMGDRGFLVNQSILHNSATKNRVSEAASRQQFRQQQHVTSTSRNRYKPPQTTSGSRGLGCLLPQLPITGGFAIKTPRQGIKSNQTARRPSNYRSLQVPPLDCENLEQTEQVDEPDYEMDSVQMTGRGSQIDPVRCLKNIFKKHEVRTRKPGVNRIAEKYRHLAKTNRSSGGGPGSRINTANTIDRNSTFDAAAIGSVTGSFSGINDSYRTGPFDAMNSISKASPRLSQPSYRNNHANQTTNPILLQREDSKPQQEVVVPASLAGTREARPDGRARNRINLQTASLGPTEPQNTNRSGAAQNESGQMPSQAPSSARGSQPNVLKNNTESTQVIRPAKSLAAKKSNGPMKLELEALQHSRGTGLSSKNANVSQRSQQVRQPYISGQQNKQAAAAPIVFDSLTEAQQAIRAKLHQMKQLFEDEDSQRELAQAPPRVGLARPDSSEWDLHNHRLMYEEAKRKRQDHLDSIEGHQQQNTVNADLGIQSNMNRAQSFGGISKRRGTEAAEDDLRDFLIDRIAQLNDGAENNNGSQESTGRFKFKASTISNVLPSGHLNEASRLAANYKNRVRGGGAKLQQKLINQQQRHIQQRASALRVTHQRTMTAHRKEVISNRSKDARSQTTGSDPGSPRTFINQVNAGETNYSVTSRSPKRHRSKERQRQVNTDLEGQVEDDAIFSDSGISTQNRSIALANARGARSPKTPCPQVDAAASFARTEPVSSNDVTARQGVQSEERNGGVNDEEQLVSDGAAIQIRDDDEQDYEHIGNGEQEFQGRPPSATAVVFMIDSDAMPAGKKVNYMTQVLRQIGAIDKQYAKESKLRKGRKPEEHAAPRPIINDFTLLQKDLEADDYDDGLKSSQGYTEKASDVSPVARMSELLQKSLRDAGQTHEDSVVRPDAVTVIHVIDGDSTSKELGAERSGLKSKTLSSRELNLNESRELTLVQAPHSQSHASTKSRVNTAENVGISDVQMAAVVVQTVPYLTTFNKRASEVTASGDRETPASSNILERGQRYSHVKPYELDEKLIVDDEQAYQLMDREEPPTLLGRAETLPHSPEQHHEEPILLGSDVIVPEKLNKTFEPVKVAVGGRGCGVSTTLSDTVYQTSQLAPIIQDHLQENPLLQVQTKSQIGMGLDYDCASHEQLQDSLPSENLASAIPNMTTSSVTGSRMSYFCPKRFNRLPRFTIFFKGQKVSQSRYVNENTVSLNSDFLKFLSDKRNLPQNNNNKRISVHGTAPQKEQFIHGAKNSATTLAQQEPSELGQLEKNITGKKLLVDIQAMEMGDKTRDDADLSMPKVPSDVEKWNEYLRQRKFDPFDRVVLVKGIDNSILTSFRTLRGENNTVSDTFKIVHRKFQPGKTNTSFQKNQVKNHADKMLYQTEFSKLEHIVDAELDEEEDYDEDVNSGFEIFHQNADGVFEHIPIPMKKEAHRLEVNPENEKKTSRTEFTQSNLQHAITAALIDMEKDGASSQDKKQSPFKAVGQTDTTMMLNPSKELFVGSTESFNFAVQNKSRMPRPKPLNILQSKNRGKNDKIDDLSMSPEKIILGATLGVHGVSPLTQLANNMIKEQHTREIEVVVVPQKNQSDMSPAVRNPKIVTKIRGTINSTQVNSIKNPILNEYHTEERDQEQTTHRKSAERSQTNKNNIDGIVAMQPNFQFNSSATVNFKKDHTEDFVPKHDESDYQFKSAASSKNQAGGGLMNIKNKGSRITEATLQLANQEGNQTNMSYGNATAYKKSLVHKADTQPARSSMQDEDYNANKISPITMSIKKKSLLIADHVQQIESPKPKGLFAAAAERHIGRKTRDLFSDSDVARVGRSREGGNIARIQTNNEDLNTSLKLVVQDSQNEYVNGSVTKERGGGYMYYNKPISPPTVNVIKSNVQSSYSNNDSNDEGGNELVNSFDLSSKRENLDLLVGSPVVHQALGGRKLQANKLEPVMLEPGSQLQNVSKVGSPRNQTSWMPSTSKHAPARDPRTQVNSKKRKAAPQPAAHVGPLKIPDSLQGMEFMAENALEDVATGVGGKKGAVGSMIDKIYTKDRKMINGAFKGNMLNTAVLTDMNRYHNIKSGTGVESKNYDTIWLQARIDEEAEEIGLSLDCAPQLLQQQPLKQPPLTALVENEAADTEHGPAQKSGDQRDSMTKLRQSLMMGGGIPENMYKMGENGSGGEVANSYGELVNRSEMGTALARSNYP